LVLATSVASLASFVELKANAGAAEYILLAIHKVVVELR